MPGYAYLYSYMRAVPSSIATLVAGLTVHCALAPRWPEVVAAAATCGRVTRGIYQRRFYAPLKDSETGTTPTLQPHPRERHASMRRTRHASTPGRSQGSGGRGFFGSHPRSRWWQSPWIFSIGESG